MKKLVVLAVSLLLTILMVSCDKKEADGGLDVRETEEVIQDDGVNKKENKEESSSAEDEKTSEKEGDKAAENSGVKSDESSNSDAANYSKPKHPTYKNDPNQEVIYIREKMFVAQTNDIYLNAQDYLGKKIKYEGMFKEYTDPRTNITYYSVIRYGPGCCGTDMNCGFEVIWLDGEAEYPEDDAWVEVEGVLGFVEGENGYKFLRLDMTSLKVLEKRGLETVLQ